MSNDKRADNDLGPLQPHNKPRKAAKTVLAGLVAAAGIAGGTAIFVANSSAGEQTPPEPTTAPAEPRMAGGPPMHKLTTKPAAKSETQPATASATQPTTQAATTKVSAEPRRLLGDMAAPVILKSETQPAK